MHSFNRFLLFLFFILLAVTAGEGIYLFIYLKPGVQTQIPAKKTQKLTVTNIKSSKAYLAWLEKNKNATKTYVEPGIGGQILLFADTKGSIDSLEKRDGALGIVLNSEAGPIKFEIKLDKLQTAVKNADGTRGTIKLDEFKKEDVVYVHEAFLLKDEKTAPLNTILIKPSE